MPVLVAWPLVAAGLSLFVLAAVGAIVLAYRAANAYAHGAIGWRTQVVLLLLAVVGLAGVLLALWGLDLRGNLGA